MSVSPRSARAARDWGSDDSAANILHVDMDSFFASVEIADDPTLAGRPVMVGGLSDRGVVTSCTYDLRDLGIHAGMPMSRARPLAPGAVILPGRRSLYKQYSQEVMEILSQISADFEPISIDEAYLDVEGARRRLGPPVKIAQLIRHDIRRKLRLPASVGIGRSKTVAKIASSHAKPDGILLVPASRTVEFLQSLPVGVLPGVGRKTQVALAEWGILEVSQLAHKSQMELARIVGPALAYELLQTSWGNDRRKVMARPAEKSISTEKTFSTNLTDRKEIERYLLAASHECAARLRSSGLLAWTVQLKLRDASFQTITRAQTLSNPTDVAREIAAAVVGLFGRESIGRGGVRLAGVGVTGLQGHDRGIQASLDDDARPRATELAMDEVHKRFGDNILRPATLIDRTSLSSPDKRQGRI